MRIKKIGIPSVLRDNDQAYLATVLNNIKGIDEDAEVTITKTISSYSFTIIVSESLRNVTIESITRLHQIMDLPINYSHTLKIAHAINFSLVL